MLITTTIVFTDEKQSEMLGKVITQVELFVFDMRNVSAIMPGAKKDESIIFLNGQDITIEIDFIELKELFIIAKK
tara:strand:- start:1161 stop:1385 length:225 start_codon:yes stop_codon:yes gene_type:complete